MIDVIAFINAVVRVILAPRFDGVPIFYIFLGSIMLRLILKSVVRTADGGVSDGE